MTAKNLFTLNNLKNAYKEINKTPGIDGVERVNEEFFEDLRFEILSSKYSPEPLVKIDIRQKNKKRPIALSSLKDKIVQKILAAYLNEKFNKSFSDKSYAYRPQKSPLKAVNRVSDFIRRSHRWVIKSDIKDFFENIDHNFLKKFLKCKIKDESLINLIMLYLKTGAFDLKNEYIEHRKGVWQGNIISPILSNIYLDYMDKFLERRGIDFVRFADDFVVFAKNKKHAEFVLRNLKRFLKLFKLSLNEEKTYITHINRGFSFLGVYFRGTYRTIDAERFEKIKNKISSFKNENFNEFIKKLETYIRTLNNYYIKLATLSDMNILKNIIIENIKHSVKNSGMKKSTLKETILNSKVLDIFENKKEALEIILSGAFSKKISTKIKEKKNFYSKKLTISSIIHITSYGMSLGVSKNRFVLKKQGKVVKYFPVSKIERIVIESGAFSLSTKVIQKCSSNNIHIDFIDRKYNPYANIVFYNSSVNQTIHKQAMILNTPKHLELAKSFIFAKLKNQKNLLVYLNKYKKEFQKEISLLKKFIEKSKKAKSIEELMGYEGAAAAVYWRAFGKAIKKEGFERVTKGAGDEVNSALNYAYAILYGKIQHALILSGLSLHISYLHALNAQKPTLVFDVIEIFRSYIVDRSIIAMINKKEPVKLNGKLLDNKSKKAIATNIYERLATYTYYKGEDVKLENIIYYQANELKNAILNDKKFRAFIGRY